MSKTIMLACAGGMSTSLLVTKMEKSAVKRNIDVSIFATAGSIIPDECKKVSSRCYFVRTADSVHVSFSY